MGFNIASEDEQRNEVRDLIRRYFDERGIPAEVADNLTAPLIVRETSELTGYKVPAVRFKYYDLSGEHLEDFIRLRFLRVGGSGDPDYRYWQPKASQPRIYLPPLVDWHDLARDTGRTITIVEGEAKAIALTRAGHPAIGLAGVWNFQTNIDGRRVIIPEFRQFNWKNRKVEFCYDADVIYKAGVQAALSAAQQCFLDLTACPSAVLLPDGPEKGADDFIAKFGPEAYAKLPREAFAPAKPLWDYNERYAFLDYPPMILALDTGLLYQPGQLRQTLLADRITLVDRAGKKREHVVLDVWKRWTLHRRYKGLDYVPGAPRDLPDGCYNKWSGWGCESKEGDVAPFLSLLEHLVHDESTRTLVLQWLAHMIQKPTEKVMTALVFHGSKQGTGKSLLTELLMDVVGTENYSIVGNDSLVSRFNDWLAFKLLIVGEEIRGREDARHDGDKLKAYITASVIRIDEKGVRHFNVKNRARFMLLSNSATPMYMEDTDRRYIVVDTRNVLPSEKGRAIKEWCRNGGAYAIRYYLEHYDLSDFSAAQVAPMTASKLKVIHSGRSSIEAWAHTLMTDDDRPPVALHSELRHLAKLETGAEPQDSAFRKALERVGAIQVGRIRIDPERRNAKERIWSLCGELEHSDAKSLRKLLKKEEANREGYFGINLKTAA